MFLINIFKGVVSPTGGEGSLKLFEDGFLDTVVWWGMVAV